MTLIRTDEVQTALIIDLLANSDVTDELDDVTEIREFNWKGTEFSYPNIRVEIVNANPNESPDCGQSFIGSIYVFSENSSSVQANQIAGIIADEYYHKSLSSNSIFFTSIGVSLISAIAQSERTWRSEVQLESMIQRV